MDKATQKRIEQIRERRQDLNQNKGNYCAQWAAMHAIQGNAIADIDFLLALVDQQEPAHETR